MWAYAKKLKNVIKDLPIKVIKCPPYSTPQRAKILTPNPT